MAGLRASSAFGTLGKLRWVSFAARSAHAPHPGSLAVVVGNEQPCAAPPSLHFESDWKLHHHWLNF